MAPTPTPSEANPQLSDTQKRKQRRKRQKKKQKANKDTAEITIDSATTLEVSNTSAPDATDPHTIDLQTPSTNMPKQGVEESKEEDIDDVDSVKNQKVN